MEQIYKCDKCKKGVSSDRDVSSFSVGNSGCMTLCWPCRWAYARGAELERERAEPEKYGKHIDQACDRCGNKELPNRFFSDFRIEDEKKTLCWDCEQILDPLVKRGHKTLKAWREKKDEST